MYHPDPTLMARMIIDERIGEAQHHHLVRDVRRFGRVETARPTAPTAQRHPRLWALVHLRHAYS
jgi:hypothetical protein